MTLHAAGSSSQESRNEHRPFVRFLFLLSSLRECVRIGRSSASAIRVRLLMIPAWVQERLIAMGVEPCPSPLRTLPPPLREECGGTSEPVPVTARAGRCCMLSRRKIPIVTVFESILSFVRVAPAADGRPGGKNLRVGRSECVVMSEGPVGDAGRGVA